jgi:hypothetical protein
VPNQKLPPVPDQYSDRLEDFDPENDWAGIVASKDVYAQKLLKTLNRRTYERDVERAHREQLSGRIAELSERIAELEHVSTARIAELEGQLGDALAPVKKSA